MARVILTQAGEDVDVGGELTVIGTRSGGEVIIILRGVVSLDPSFNAGGDTVRLPDDAAFFTVRLVGSSAVIAGLGVSVSIPVGSAGLQVSFNDETRTLLFDALSSAVKLGDQTVTATAANIAPAGGSPTLIGTEGPDMILGTEGKDVIDGLGGADRINGGAGNDLIRGGAGGDDLDGSFGSDQLYGGPGDDRIYDDEGASTYLDGGTGNDWLSVLNYAGTRFDLIGGDGDDLIDVAIGTVGTAAIDAGAGADRVVMSTAGMP
jgi:Ca2+-binding RTX toxin-like protein